MNKDRFIYIVVAIVLAVLLLLTTRTVIATNAVVSQGSDLSDYALRHSSYALPMPMTGAADDTGLSDWFIRHPASTNAGTAPDLSDYYLRHPALSH